MAIETDRLISPAAASPQEEPFERSLAPAPARRVRRPGEDPRPARDLHPGGAHAARGARPRAALRPAGPRQDHARAHHRQRDGREPPPDLRPGARAPGRPRRAPHQPRAERRALHRRDPPPLAGGRGDPLPGARGLPDRHHDRRGAGGALDQARPAAVHARRRHHARRHAHQPAARPLRHRRAARVLHAGGARRIVDRSAGLLAVEIARRRRTRDRAPLARYAARREPAAAPRARLRPGEGRRRDHARRSPTRR